VFGTVRNPWDWWVSWYSATDGGRKLQGLGGERVRAENFSDFWDTILSTSFSIGELDMARINELGMGPYTYRFILRYFRDPESVLRTWDVNRVKVNIEDLMYPVHLCRVENLRDDMLAFFSSIDLRLTEEQVAMLLEAPVDNPSKHEATATYYDDRLLALVSDKDRLIVDLYGYTI
jgi:hypothetical protein